MHSVQTRKGKGQGHTQVALTQRHGHTEWTHGMDTQKRSERERSKGKEQMPLPFASSLFFFLFFPQSNCESLCVHGDGLCLGPAASTMGPLLTCVSLHSTVHQLKCLCVNVCVCVCVCLCMSMCVCPCGCVRVRTHRMCLLTGSFFLLHV